jgi:hypothetical protein
MVPWNSNGTIVFTMLPRPTHIFSALRLAINAVVAKVACVVPPLYTEIPTPWKRRRERSGGSWVLLSVRGGVVGAGGLALEAPQPEQLALMAPGEAMDELA